MLDQWYEPSATYFKVQTVECKIYLLHYDDGSDQGEIPFEWIHIEQLPDVAQYFFSNLTDHSHKLQGRMKNR